MLFGCLPISTLLLHPLAEYFDLHSDHRKPLFSPLLVAVAFTFAVSIAALAFSIR